MSSLGHKPCIQPVQSTRLHRSCPVRATSLVSSLYNQPGCIDRVQSTPQALYPTCTINQVARIVSSQRHKPCIHPVHWTSLQESCPVNATSLVSILYNQQGCKDRVQSRSLAASLYNCHICYSQYLSSHFDPVTSHCSRRQHIHLQRRNMLP